jgi:4-hydroxy-3-polyprenylbenzoate decarboxylase
MRTVVGITGASGAPYAVTLLRHLQGEIDLVVSKDARKVIALETDTTAEALAKLATNAYAPDDVGAEIASGSARYDAAVIVPCSGNTLAKVATGLADNLITRVAAVCLKERRELILVPRETPLGTVALDHMAALSRLGVTILPASPGFYGKAETPQDLVDFVVARILDRLGQPSDLGARWRGL